MPIPTETLQDRTNGVGQPQAERQGVEKNVYWEFDGFLLREVGIGGNLTVTANARQCGEG